MEHPQRERSLCPGYLVVIQLHRVHRPAAIVVVLGVRAEHAGKQDLRARSQGMHRRSLGRLGLNEAADDCHKLTRFCWRVPLDPPVPSEAGHPVGTRTTDAAEGGERDPRRSIVIRFAFARVMTVSQVCESFVNVWFSRGGIGFGRQRSQQRSIDDLVKRAAAERV